MGENVYRRSTRLAHYKRGCFMKQGLAVEITDDNCGGIIDATD